MQSPLPPPETDPTPEIQLRPFSEVLEDATEQAIDKIRRDARAFADNEEAKALLT